MAVTRNRSDIVLSEQTLLKRSIDDEFEILAVELLGYDGNSLVRQAADEQQIKSVQSGDYYYFCFAPVGTAEATAAWKCFRVDSIGKKVYADGNADYDNAASDPSALTYTYA